MKAAILAATAAASTVAATTDPSLTFDTWRINYGKSYTSVDEEQTRRKVWAENKILIESINNAHLGWTAELNQFADISLSEFKSKYLMPSHSMNSTVSEKSYKLQSTPDSFDWRAKNVVTSVKDQGSVGSCWAFSTIGNIEGQWALAGNNLVDLSPEFLVDCDGTSDPANNHADCSVFGGWPYIAYQYLIAAGGVPSEQSWPYCSGKGDCYPCMQGPVSLCGPPPLYCDPTIATKCPNAVFTAKISSWERISSDESQMSDALVSKGPLSVLLDATQLQFYKSGIWEGYLPGSPKALGCTKQSLNHAVLLVGYGEENSSPYWTVKNSWGAKWGENGYFRILKDAGTCGINTQVTSAIV